MVNKELAKSTMAAIKAQPEKHDQDYWVTVNDDSPCGTTMCFAGHAAVLAGAEIPDPKKHLIADWYVGPDGAYHNWKDAEAGRVPGAIQVKFFAQNALGITSDERDFMFADYRTVEELEVAVEELVEHGAIQTWEEDYDDDDWDGCDDPDCCG